MLAAAVPSFVVSRTPNNRTPRSGHRSGQVRELCPLLPQWEQRRVISEDSSSSGPGRPDGMPELATATGGNFKRSIFADGGGGRVRRRRRAPNYVGGKKSSEFERDRSRRNESTPQSRRSTPQNPHACHETLADRAAATAFHRKMPPTTTTSSAQRNETSTEEPTTPV